MDIKDFDSFDSFDSFDDLELLKCDHLEYNEDRTFLIPCKNLATHKVTYHYLETDTVEFVCLEHSSKQFYKYYNNVKITTRPPPLAKCKHTLTKQ